MSLTETIVHERRVSRLFKRDELLRLVAEAAAAEAGVSLDSHGVDFKVNFEDVTEGSPAYRVGMCARVELVIDLTPPQPDLPPAAGRP